MRRRLVVSGLVLGLAVSAVPLASAADRGAGCRPAPVTGLTAQQAGAMVKARTRYFGAENVDPRSGAVDCSRVLVTWLNNSSFAASFLGRVVLFDAFFPTHNPGWIPTNAFEMGDVQADYLFVGHGHYDHAQEVPRVLNRSRRTVLVGTPEHCDQMRTALQGKFRPRCVAAVPRAAALGAVGRLDSLLTGVRISTVRIPHSAADTPDPLNPNGPYAPFAGVPAFRSRLSNPPAPLGAAPPAENDGVSPGDGAEGGSVLYQFRIGDFAWTYHDTTGPVKVGDLVWKALRRLPPTDVEYGAVVAFGTVTNGFRDTRVVTEALRSRQFLPMHHDDWNEALGSEAWSYEKPVRDELSRIPVERRPQVRWLFDPTDYLSSGVRSWDPRAATWRDDFPAAPDSAFARAEDRSFAVRYARRTSPVVAVRNDCAPGLPAWARLTASGCLWQR